MHYFLSTLQDVLPHGHSHIVELIREYIGYMYMQYFRQTSKVLHRNITAFTTETEISDHMSNELESRNFVVGKSASWQSCYTRRHACMRKVSSLTIDTYMHIEHGKDMLVDCQFLPEQLYKIRLYGVIVHNIQKLPQTLLSLCFSTDTKVDLQIEMLPKTLRRLSLGLTKEDVVLDFTSLKNLVILSLGRCAGSVLWNTIPNTLKSLDMGFTNIEIDFSFLPSKLQTLKLGRNFNYEFKLEMLPKKLSHLDFGFAYEHPIIISKLPKDLHTLKLGVYFNQFIDTRELPRKLVKLVLGDNFNQPFETKYLPPQLKYLNMGECFSHHIELNKLPKTLKALTLNLYMEE